MKVNTNNKSNRGVNSLFLDALTWFRIIISFEFLKTVLAMGENKVSVIRNEVVVAVHTVFVSETNADFGAVLPQMSNLQSGNYKTHELLDFLCLDEVKVLRSADSFECDQETFTKVDEKWVFNVQNSGFIVTNCKFDVIISDKAKELVRLMNRTGYKATLFSQNCDSDFEPDFFVLQLSSQINNVIRRSSSTKYVFYQIVKSAIVDKLMKVISLPTDMYNDSEYLTKTMMNCKLDFVLEQSVGKEEQVMENLKVSSQLWTLSQKVEFLSFQGYHPRLEDFQMNILLSSGGHMVLVEDVQNRNGNLMYRVRALSIRDGKPVVRTTWLNYAEIDEHKNGKFLWIGVYDKNVIKIVRDWCRLVRLIPPFINLCERSREVYESSSLENFELNMPSNAIAMKAYIEIPENVGEDN